MSQRENVNVTFAPLVIRAREKEEARSHAVGLGGGFKALQIATVE